MKGNGNELSGKGDGEMKKGRWGRGDGGGEMGEGRWEKKERGMIQYRHCVC